MKRPIKDTDLLRAAARRPGIAFDTSRGEGFDMQGNAVLSWHNGVTWNPLNRSDEAFALLSVLCGDIFFNQCTVRVEYGDHKFVERFDHPDAKERAGRRAIVRCAAFLGGVGLPS